MAQTLLAFESHPADPHTGWQIGWDHAHHALVPPAEQLHDGNPVRAGWQAGKACFGTHTLGASRRVRQWLQLRIHAWQRGRAFDLDQVTPHYLGQIEAVRCPILRTELVGGDASVDRVRDDAAYAAGNLAVISREAHRAKGAMGWAELLVQAQQAEAAGPIGGLDAAHWLRLALLVSFVTPLPLETAARLPLRLLPPNRLRLLNPVQGLQVLATRELGRADGARRLRTLCALLPGEALRLDFNLFVSALLPRLIETGHGGDAFARRHALEDAWGDARVNRRWQRFALQLDEALIERLVRTLAPHGSAGVLCHSRELATEAWALECRGRAVERLTVERRFGKPVLPTAIRARITASRSRTADGHLPA